MLPAAYFDGQTARRHAATLEISAGLVIVRWPGHERRDPLAGVAVSESIAGAPRTLTFADGAFCDVADDTALRELLAQAGWRDPHVARWQASWIMAGASVLVIVLLAVVGYLYGLPALAEYAADKLPPQVEAQLARRTLSLLDSQFLDATTLSRQRRAELIAGFNALRYPPEAPEKDVDLHFRSGRHLGPNAFTLADGTMVLLDELILLADNDEHIYAVMAHELGHAHFHHGLKVTLQATVLATVMFAWVGDVSVLLATLPAVALQARYSRAFEDEADLYSARLLKANGIAPSRLAEMLEKLEAELRKSKQKGRQDEDDEQSLGNFLASHPSTPARIARLRAMD